MRTLVLVATAVWALGGCAVELDPSAEVGFREETQSATRADVVFENCSEFAGLSPVPSASADALVPDKFQVIQTDGVANLVVRVANCEKMQVGRGQRTRGTVSQIGINIAGDNSGQSITNYTLWYVTDNRALYNALRAQGLAPIYDCDLSYAVSNGVLTFAAENQSSPRYVASGAIGTPSVPLPFVATWVEQGRRGAVAARTVLPDILFDFGAQVTLQAAPGSDLAKLAGGTTLTFPYLNSFNTFERAEMTLTRL
jgi:hypothetical protein